MSVLTLAVAAPEPDRLVEADDETRDVVSAVEDAVRRDGLERRLVSRALVFVTFAAAARQALTAGPSFPRLRPLPQTELPLQCRRQTARMFDFRRVRQWERNRTANSRS